MEDIRNANMELLHINMDELQVQIQKGEKDWEKWVPERVSELIKNNCLFGYPCLPEVRDNLTKNFNNGI